MESSDNIKQQLREQLREIVGRNGDLRERLRDKDPAGNWSYEELGTEGEFDDVFESLGEIGRAEANQVWQALLRVDAGTYGLCTSCGKRISEERLKALPAAEFCVDCATKLEAR